LAAADCVLALQGVLRQQDLALMQVAIDKGKPVMFAVNKTDCIPAAERGPVLKQLLKQLHDAISQVRPSAF
jgi:predicted GTPase